LSEIANSCCNKHVDRYLEVRQAYEYAAARRLEAFDLLIDDEFTRTGLGARLRPIGVWWL